MARGHSPKREKKRAKQKVAKPSQIFPEEFTSAEVEVIKKKRKPRHEEEL